MINYTINFEVNGTKVLTEATWKYLPRVDDIIVHKDTKYTVIDIEHNYDVNTPTVTLQLEVKGKPKE